MSSFISGVKSFLLNTVLQLLPKSVILTIFDKMMLPKAVDDLNLVMESFHKQVAKDKYRLAEDGSKYVRTHKPYVIGLVGLPQTGKSTVAEVLMHETGLIPVNSNLIRNWLIDAKRNYANIDAIVLSCMVSLIKSEEIGVIMDSDCVSPAKRAFTDALAWRAGADVEYIAVTTTPSVWKARLFGAGHFIHRMYADGIRFGHAAAGNVHAIVLKEHVQACVVSEWERQTPMHKKYMSTVPLISTIHNDGSIVRLREKVKTLAGSLVL